MAASWCVGITLCILSVVAATTVKTESGKCLRDESLGDRFDFNVYYCNDPGKPNCCQIDDQFTCCEAAATHVVEEQAILWGTLGGIIALMALICVCYHKDSRCCDPGRPCCCECCNRRKEDKAVIIDDPEFFDPGLTNGMKDALSIDVQQADDDSGRGSACSSPYPSTVQSARSSRSLVSRDPPRSAGSERSEHPATPGPSHMADIQL